MSNKEEECQVTKIHLFIWGSIDVLTELVMIFVWLRVAYYVAHIDLTAGGIQTESVVEISCYLIGFIVAWIFNCRARTNYRTGWRLLESYAYKNFLIRQLKDDGLNNVVTNANMNTNAKLLEVLVENLADDPSKRMFE